MSLTSTLWRTLAAIDARTGISDLYHDRLDVVLVYHSVGELDKFGNVSVERFREDLEYLQRKYDVVPLAELLHEDDGASRKRVAVTFDDAHGNFYTCAHPIISDLGVPATLFVPEAFVGGEQRELAKDRLGLSAVDSQTFVSEKQIRAMLKDGFVELGNHTRTHADLSEITDHTELEREIVGAKDRLEDRFDTTVRSFAYPYGATSESAATIVERTHSSAVTSEPGTVTPERGIYLIPRVSGHLHRSQVRWELTDLAETFRKVNNLAL